jgi:hypothetical protein
MTLSVHYYNVTLDNELTVVKANNTTQVRHHIMDILRGRYDYKRAQTDDVIQYLSTGGEIEDLTLDEDELEDQDAEVAA